MITVEDLLVANEVRFRDTYPHHVELGAKHLPQFIGVQQPVFIVVVQREQFIELSVGSDHLAWAAGLGGCGINSILHKEYRRIIHNKS